MLSAEASSSSLGCFIHCRFACFHFHRKNYYIYILNECYYVKAVAFGLYKLHRYIFYLSEIAFPSRGGHNTLNFIETTQYNPLTANSSRTPLPRDWRQYQHPNGDVYFHDHALHLTTSENIRDAMILRYILKARSDHIARVANDPRAPRLPRDIELVISEITCNTAVIRMYSRSTSAAYCYGTRTGLRVDAPEEFWTHIAEFPSHHRSLPVGAETTSVEALRRAQTAVSAGTQYCFPERTIGKIVGRYQELVALREQGRDIVPPLAWLIGVVMPLEPVGRDAGGINIDHILNAQWL